MQVNKSITEDMLMKNLNIVILLHETFNIKNKRNV